MAGIPGRDHTLNRLRGLREQILIEQPSGRQRFQSYQTSPRGAQRLGKTFTIGLTREQMSGWIRIISAG